MSVAKGLHLAFDRLARVKGEALQIFTRNQRQWSPPPLNGSEIQDFTLAREQAGNLPIASHASYLINLATGKPELADKSCSAFAAELQRCQQLAIPYVVIHPGSHTGDGVEIGIERFTSNLDRAIKQAATSVMVLLETTAGQGTGLGSRFEELAAIRNNSRYADNIGICLDTCHIFAAGYDIRTPAAYAATMAELDNTVGLEQLRFFHLNDSKKELASRVDRHAHIGQGAIGLEGFRNLLNDPRFSNHPMVLETPKSNDLHEDMENLDLLRSLYR